MCTVTSNFKYCEKQNDQMGLGYYLERESLLRTQFYGVMNLLSL